MPKIWKSCLPFGLRLKSIFTRKTKSVLPEKERRYALLSDPDTESDSDSNCYTEQQPEATKVESKPRVTCKYLEDPQNQIQDPTIEENVRSAGEYLRPKTPPTAKNKTKPETEANVEVKERYVGFGIGGAGNMRRLV